MKEENKKHVQLPNDMTKDGLTPQDLLVYISIKRYAAGNEAWPSLATIRKHCGASINTIRNCIDRLVDKEYISVKKIGRVNHYYFSSYKKFEPFSDSFLDNENLTFLEKAYILSAQQHMFKDIENFGKITYTNQELSEIINMPESTISKCNRSLEKKEYLTTVKTNAVDYDGNIIHEKVFHLNELGQRVIWTLCKHDEEIKENSKNIDSLKEKIESQEKLINQLIKKVNAMQKEQHPDTSFIVD